MTRPQSMLPEGEVPVPAATDDREYACPVCGIMLFAIDFAGPEQNYFCPYCCTRQRPSARLV